MDQLEKFVRMSRYRKKPLDLLTLSACQTAAENDRAALGLAGLSVKAGAKSVLGTLWPIFDRASSDLVIEFYRQLKRPELTKARALQLAQIALLSDDRYRHPSFWSPFMLIGNWI
jgi:CHAT domain-containing protein